MNIGMLLDGYYPNDIRVKKEAETLAKQHNVFILCKRKKNEIAYEKINNVKVFRQIVYYSNIKKGIIDILSSIFFIHPFFQKKLPLFIKNNKIDVLHIHDLPLAKTGYLAAKKNKIPCVLDLHENYPEGLKIWFSWRKNILFRLKNKLFFNYNRWYLYEKKMMKKFDFIITVVDEMKKRIIQQHNSKASKIFVVTNAENKDFVNYYKKENNAYFSKKNSFIISYVGGLAPHRGLHTAICGMQKITKKIPSAHLFLIGPAMNYVKNHLKNLILKKRLTKNVSILDPVSFEKVIQIMKNSHLNIIPHESNPHTENTIPHKIYQILLSEQPILVSDCVPLKKVISNNKIGKLFKAGNAESFAHAVIKIYNNYDDAKAKAKKGFDVAFHGNLNWEKISAPVLEKIYKKIKH